MENLTPKQNELLTRLELICHAKKTDVWVGTWEDLTKMGGNRDLLNQLEQRGYIASYMQIGDYWTVKPSRSQGMERDAIDDSLPEQEFEEEDENEYYRRMEAEGKQQQALRDSAAFEQSLYDEGLL